MNRPALFLACRQFACMALLAGVRGAFAQVPEEPPEWVDEPPTLSRWIEEGYDAELRHLPRRAAQRYCAAARYGNTSGRSTR